jgi:UDP-N-acetylglucosamine 2-epimerase (non-hydrolysing)
MGTVGASQKRSIGPVSRAKIVLIVGTRPECIKLAPLYLELRGSAWADTILLGTGQHGSLAAQTLGSLGLDLDVALEPVGETGSLAMKFGGLVTALGAELERLRPDLVLVQGDTTSALAGAVAAFYLGVPVGHVEAGLRTGDTSQPFPEEFHRQALARAATLHFAPTAEAAERLSAEGIRPERVTVTGNTGIDALRRFLPLAPASKYPVDEGRRLVLVTMHRRENLGAPMSTVCAAINELHDRMDDLEFVLPVHPNPAVRPALERSLNSGERIHLVPPQNYLEMLSLLDACTLVLTDSGGVQEEAPTLGKPVLVLRNVTDRPETIAAGSARLVGTATVGIVAAARELLDNPEAMTAMANRSSLFGDGHASERIVAACKTFLDARLNQHGGADRR